MTEVSKLQNDVQFIYKQNKNTPRMALCLNFSINQPEETAGIYTLMARLLLQGTKKYNSEQLANEFEKYAIDFSSELFPNYLRIKFVCLNEDFSKALELMDDILKNSTFEEFEKERTKLIGEISAELDSPGIRRCGRPYAPAASGRIHRRALGGRGNGHRLRHFDDLHPHDGHHGQSRTDGHPALLGARGGERPADRHVRAAPDHERRHLPPRPLGAVLRTHLTLRPVHPRLGGRPEGREVALALPRRHPAARPGGRPGRHPVQDRRQHGHGGADHHGPGHRRRRPRLGGRPKGVPGEGGGCHRIIHFI